jgi:predicted glycosyltransferase
MAGYNTMMDVLLSGIRAMVYPVTANGDQEQIVRAESLAKAGIIDVIRTEELAPRELARKVERALSKTPTSLTLNCEGAINSVHVLKKHLAAHRARMFDAPQPSLRPPEAGNAQPKVSDSAETRNGG